MHPVVATRCTVPAQNSLLIVRRHRVNRLEPDSEPARDPPNHSMAWILLALALPLGVAGAAYGEIAQPQDGGGNEHGPGSAK